MLSIGKLAQLAQAQEERDTHLANRVFSFRELTFDADHVRPRPQYSMMSLTS
jgi:hypothetical protein